jgi:excisionase family DNA binding protein
MKANEVDVWGFHAIEVALMLLVSIVAMRAEKQEEYLSVKEAATCLNASMPYTRKLIYAGALGCVKIGRFLRVPRSEVQRLIAEHTMPPMAARVEATQAK